MTAQTPGQAAYEAYAARHSWRRPIFGGPMLPYAQLNDDTREDWEALAQAAIDAFLAGDSVSAESIREALAAQERPASASASQARRREEQAAPELAAAMREARGYREGIAGLLDELKTSAAATHPSKKSQIESAVIRKLQKILDGK